MSTIEKIDDDKTAGIVGGFANIPNIEFKPRNHDKSWKKRIREIAEKFDSQKFHTCVCGTCPGCGDMVGRAGDVCNECRKEAGCLRKSSH